MVEVIWSPLAIETYYSIIEYLFQKFGEVAVVRFVRHVENKIKLISARPTMFRPTRQRPNIYITSIRKKTTLTYRYNPLKKQVELIIFWGMQNPNNKPI